MKKINNNKYRYEVKSKWIMKIINTVRLNSYSNRLSRSIEMKKKTKKIKRKYTQCIVIVIVPMNKTLLHAVPT